MKKVLCALVAMSLLISVPAFAKETKKDEVAVSSMGMSMGMPKTGMEKMCGSKSVKTQMVATDEGGVIVLAGNKLMKYDADLKLVKEAEIKMPMSSMSGMSGGKQCPMMGKMPPAESQEKTA